MDTVKMTTNNKYLSAPTYRAMNYYGEGVYKALENGTTLGENPLMLSLINPFGFTAKIPDINLTPTLTKQVNVAKTIKNNAVEGMFVINWYSRDTIIRHYIRSKVTGKMNYFQAIVPDQLIQDVYDLNRFVTGGLRIQSATTSGTKFNVSGVLTATMMQRLPELRSLSYDSIMSYKINTNSILVNIPVEKGIVALSGLDSTNTMRPNKTLNVFPTEYITRVYLETDSLAWNQLYIDTLNTVTVGTILFDTNNIDANKWRPANVWGNMEFEWKLEFQSENSPISISVDVDYEFSTCTDDGTETKHHIVKTINPYVQPFIAMTTYAKHNINCVYDLTRISVSVSFTTSNLIKIGQGRINDFGLNATYYDVYEKQARGPSTIIGYSNIGLEQDLTLGGSFNYEVVPDSELSKQIGELVSGEGHPDDLNVIKVLLSNNKFRYVLTLTDYENLLKTTQKNKLTDRIELANQAAGVYDIFKPMLKSLSPVVGGLIGSMFGLQAPGEGLGKMIGDTMFAKGGENKKSTTYYASGKQDKIEEKIKNSEEEREEKEEKEEEKRIEEEVENRHIHNEVIDFGKYFKKDENQTFQRIWSGQLKDGEVVKGVVLTFKYEDCKEMQPIENENETKRKSKKKKIKKYVKKKEEREEKSKAKKGFGRYTASGRDINGSGDTSVEEIEISEIDRKNFFLQPRQHVMTTQEKVGYVKYFATSKEKDIGIEEFEEESQSKQGDVPKLETEKPESLITNVGEGIDLIINSFKFKEALRYAAKDMAGIGDFFPGGTVQHAVDFNLVKSKGVRMIRAYANKVDGVVIGEDGTPKLIKVMITPKPCRSISVNKNTGKGVIRVAPYDLYENTKLDLKLYVSNFLSGEQMRKQIMIAASLAMLTGEVYVTPSLGEVIEGPSLGGALYWLFNYFPEGPVITAEISKTGELKEIGNIMVKYGICRGQLFVTSEEDTNFAENTKKLPRMSQFELATLNTRKPGTKMPSVVLLGDISGLTILALMIMYNKSAIVGGARNTGEAGKLVSMIKGGTLDPDRDTPKSLYDFIAANTESIVKYGVSESNIKIAMTKYMETGAYKNLIGVYNQYVTNMSNPPKMKTAKFLTRRVKENPKTAIKRMRKLGIIDLPDVKPLSKEDEIKRKEDIKFNQELLKKRMEESKNKPRIGKGIYKKFNEVESTYENLPGEKPQQPKKEEKKIIVEKGKEEIDKLNELLKKEFNK